MSSLDLHYIRDSPIPQPPELISRSSLGSSSKTFVWYQTFSSPGFHYLSIKQRGNKETVKVVYRFSINQNRYVLCRSWESWYTYLLRWPEWNRSNKSSGLLTFFNSIASHDDSEIKQDPRKKIDSNDSCQKTVLFHRKLVNCLICLTGKTAKSISGYGRITGSALDNKYYGSWVFELRVSSRLKMT